MLNKVEFYRNSKGMTQNDLANKIGKTRQHVSKIENGKINPSLQIAFRIALVLQVDINELFYEENEENEENIV